MPVKLSTPSKMKGTAKTWSLQAIETCPGSLGADGALVPACASCYATKGLYHMPTVKAPRAYNREDWQREAWVDEMVQAIGKAKYFRWFDSGDMYALPLAEKIYQVMRALPNTKFWLPTRMHKFPKFADVIARMEKLPNVVVRRSSDSVTGETIPGKTTSTIIATDSQAGKAHVCPATLPGNVHTCAANNCTACWDKNVKIIAYSLH